MRKWKRIVSLGMCAFLLCSFGETQAGANSARMRWDGMDATGAMVTEENCPVIVEKEVLTFDIPEFPKEYYREAEEYLAYDARATAEYTFYNPADYTVTATLLFPFGNEPDYAYYGYDTQEEEKNFNIDTQKYDILVNGQPVEKKIRHTLSYSHADFELEKDLVKLHDSFMTDEFYLPDMLSVTAYVYKVSGVNTETYRAATVAFDVKKNDTTRKYYFVNQSGFHTQKDGDARISTWVEDSYDETKLVLYVIGEPLGEQPEWKLYKDGGVEDGEEIAGTVTYVSQETVTLKEFALTGWSEESGVSESDWYNAVIQEMKEDETHNSYGILSLDRYGQGLSRNLMRWYEYEITIGPGERLVNTVTAPMYPGIMLDFEPPVYNYAYLLSPAKNWASFLELQVVINTPYYVVNSNIQGLEQTGTGYMAFLDGLPAGECEFSLSAELNPKAESGYDFGISRKKIRIAILICCIALCVIGAVNTGMRRKQRKKAGIEEID